MSTLSIEKSHSPKSGAPRKGCAKSDATACPDVLSAAVNRVKSHNPKHAAPKTRSLKPKTIARPEVGSAMADAEKPSNPTSAASKKTTAKLDPTRQRKASPIRTIAETSQQAIETSPEAAEAHESKFESTTKQDRVLGLLSRREGASIEEMMQATNWQQHSVRGFLAGAVKKKLGFSLASFKPDSGARRYHIATHRAR